MSGIYKFQKSFLLDGNIRVNRRRGDTSYFLHRHDYYELILYRGCGGVCELNGEPCEISKNCLFLLTPNDFHKIDAHNNEDSESIILSFSESFADKELVAKIGFTPRIWYDTSELCGDLLEHLYKLYCRGGEDNELKMHYLLNALLCEVLGKSRKAKEETHYISPTVGRAMSTVLADVSADITLTGLAAACGMTPAYFSDLFHREVGKSFKKWLNSIRVEYAKRLLEEIDRPVIEVCLECGYNTPSQFIKMFKRETGMTPTEYRKRQKDKA